LIKAGPIDEKNPDALVLENWKNLVGTALGYDYAIEEPPRSNSSIRHTRGKLLGGTSSINTAIAFLTPNRDLDERVRQVAEG